MKEHLCKTCGEKDPEKFVIKYKTTCKACRNEQKKQYRQDNKETFAARDKQYYQDNKEARSEYYKQWRQNNKETISEKQNKYYIENKEARSEKAKQYYLENKEAISARKNHYRRKRKQTDPGFKYLCDLRVRQNAVLKGIVSTTKGLGINTQELKDYFESLFQPGMSHDNHGEWHIDHIIPISSYKRDSEGGFCIESEYNKSLVHYTNLQPLWAEDNLKKSNKIL